MYTYMYTHTFTKHTHKTYTHSVHVPLPSFTLVLPVDCTMRLPLSTDTSLHSPLSFAFTTPRAAVMLSSTRTTVRWTLTRVTICGWYWGLCYRDWRERDKVTLSEKDGVCMCVCVCVCEREREREEWVFKVRSPQPPDVIHCTYTMQMSTTLYMHMYQDVLRLDLRPDEEDEPEWSSTFLLFEPSRASASLRWRLLEGDRGARTTQSIHRHTHATQMCSTHTQSKIHILIHMYTVTRPVASSWMCSAVFTLLWRYRITCYKYNCKGRALGLQK